MIEQSTPQQERITCSIAGPRNPFERDKLVATLVPEGIRVYCRACQDSHLIARETCIAAWEQGKSVQCQE